MLAEIETLLILQDRDQKLRNLQIDLERIPAEEEAARARLTDDEKHAADAKTAMQANGVAIKNLELDIQTRQDSLAKLRVQQFETKKNEEFHRMGEEIENYGVEISKLEDSALELMELGETLQDTLDEAKAKLEASQKLVDDELVALGKRRQNCQTQIAELQAVRTTIAAKLDEDIISIYDRLFATKGASAVVRLEDGQCKGCHMKVIKSTEMSARAEKQVTHCENCARIVYFHS